MTCGYRKYPGHPQSGAVYNATFDYKILLHMTATQSSKAN